MPEVWEGKKYKCTETVGFDEFLKALGVGFVLRKIVKTVSPTVELKKDGDKFTLVTLSTFKNTEMQFELGKKFDEVLMDGRTVKSMCILEGNKLTHTQYGEPECVIVREFDEKQMIATMKVKDVVCTRKYVALE